MNVNFFLYVLKLRVSAKRDRRSERIKDIVKELFRDKPEEIIFIGRYGLAWKVIFKRYTLKCYQTESLQRANEIVESTALLKRNNIVIPDIVAKKNKFLFAEWIEGTPLSDTISRSSDYLPVQKMAEYQASIHQIKGHRDKRDFAQWKFIKKRLVELAYLRWDRKTFEDILRYIEKTDLRIKNLSQYASPTVTNPGFTPDNVVIANDGKLCLIDNEFLLTGIGKEFDLYYTLNHLSRIFDITQKRYLQYYSELVDIRDFYKYYSFWESIEAMRIFGKQLSFYRSDPNKTLSLLH